jgi:hypothetical protein
MRNADFGLRPPAQAPPHRGFCPVGRALWLGENAEFNKIRMNELMGNVLGRES